jgi:hypothetical protein
MILPTPTIIIMEFIYFVFGSHDMILAEWLLAVVLKISCRQTIQIFSLSFLFLYYPLTGV